MGYTQAALDMSCYRFFRETNGITCLANAVWARSDGCFGAISTAVRQIGSPLKSLVLAESMRALLNRLQFMSTQLRQLMKVEII